MLRLNTLLIVWAMALLSPGGHLLANAVEDPKAASDSASVATTQAGDSTLPLPHKVTVYYFHGDVRCATCRRMETYTREAIDSAYSAELKDGRLEFRVVNTDSAANTHFVTDYQLYTRTVILSDVHSGKQSRWKNLDKIWALNGDKAEFMKYIQSEVTAFLDPGK